MSLDTVLQIGKVLRQSENKMKYFKYVEDCPKNKDGSWPVCITIPVKEDFSFDWDSVCITPENEREKLYYLKYKTSNNDTSQNKYFFGDIFYSLKTDIDNKTSKVKETKDFGNYTLKKGTSAFHNALKLYKEIVKKCNLERDNKLVQFHSAFEQNLDKFTSILMYAPAFEYILSESNSNISTCLNDREKLKDKYIRYVYQNVSDKIKKQLFGKQDKLLLINDILIFLTDVQKQNILQYADFSVFIHFEFPKDNSTIHWHEIKDVFDLLKDQLNSKITRKTEFGLVPNAYIYRTLCSGTDDNDIQFPNFELDNAYKSFVFRSDDFTDFLYADSILNKSFKRLYKTKIDMFIYPIAIQGKDITAIQYDTFFDKTNEDLLQSNEDPLLFLTNKEPTSFNKYDFILSDSSGNTSNDLIEISGIDQSDLKSISKYINEVALKIRKERKESIRSNEKLQIENSLLKILGTYYINKSAYLEVRVNHRYKSHLLKVLPLIYTRCYYSDDMLLLVFINNIENIVRLVKENRCGYKYEDLKYDLKFLLSIQNSNTNKFMEIVESKSYQIGLKIGKLAKPLRKKINSFEKKYVGLLTRHVNTKDDCVEFLNDINEMLVRHEKAWPNLSAETSNELANLTNTDYNKENIAFGFFEGYFKYEVIDQRKDFVSRLEKLLANYEGNPNLESELEKLSELLNDINI